MEMIKTCWYRGLAIAALTIITALYGPAALNKAGFPTPRFMGDGSKILFSAVILYIIATASVAGLLFSTIRRYFIPQDNQLSKFFIPLVVVISYVVWGSLALYSLSQATDL